jgi:hypothetical protein
MKRVKCATYSFAGGVVRELEECITVLCLHRGGTKHQSNCSRGCCSLGTTPHLTLLHFKATPHILSIAQNLTQNSAIPGITCHVLLSSTKQQLHAPYLL